MSSTTFPRILACLALILAPVPPAATAAPVTEPGLPRALEAAGANRPEIERALADARPEVRPHLAWLVARMPAEDLKSLDAAFLVAHVAGAFEAWTSAPWRSEVDEATFRDAILPYASVSERRELWLPALREKCLSIVGDATTPAEAAVRLNQRIFPEWKVAYSTKRRRADQSPSESIESGLASCTGLSILLIDACRSVGVPARFVGVPLWTDGSGNHSWVEVWDGARWRYTGAAEPTGDRLDEAWFSARASGQDRSRPEHAIYAVTWRESGVEFPMVFDPTRPRARAVDVTDRYRGLATPLAEGEELLRIVVRDGSTRLRVAAEVEVRDESGAPVARGRSKDERFDLNDHLEVAVPAGGWRGFLVDGRRVEEVTVVARDGRTVLVALAVPGATDPSPGAVSGRGRPLDERDVDALVDGDFEPASLIIDDDATLQEPPGNSGRAAPLRALQTFLRTGVLADVPGQAFATTPLDAREAERASAIVRRQSAQEVRKRDRAAFDARVLEAGGAKMRFWYETYGEKPKTGRSLWISMHGGGGAPPQVNDQQWENQKRLYRPEEGVYVAPRAPTDTWDLWHQGHVGPLFDALIRCMVEFEDVDPDRVYLMGYSAGGDGVYQLAPRMADRFAAAAMMAGHPNETRPDGLRNLPFALLMGGKDAAFNRNEIARQWKTSLAGLAAKDPGGYPHEVTIFEENGHWMERKDAVAVPWMARHVRDLRPRKVVWLQDDVVEPRFYWLANPAPKQGQRIEASIDGQVVRIDDAAGVDELRIRLDDSMVDLSKAVTVRHGDSILFDGIAPRSIATIARTMLERSDPEGVFTAEVAVRLRPPQPPPEAAAP